MRRSESEAGRSLAGRTLDVLAAVADGGGSVTLGNIARRARLPPSTAHRIIGELVGWGALERVEGGGYQVGLRLWEMASHAPWGLPLREVALPVMEDLYEATHENVQLAVREDLEVVYIERLTGRGAVPVLTRVGGRFALHATGVGLVLLAHAPSSVQTQVLTGPLQRWTDYTITDVSQLRAVLADVRRTGVAVSDRQVTEDAVSVACPLRDAEDNVIAALSVVVTVGRHDPIAVVPAVRTAARAISRALGSRAAATGGTRADTAAPPRARGLTGPRSASHDVAS